MSAISGITQNEAAGYANATRADVTIGEHYSVSDANPNATGRVRAPDVIDPYQMSQARRKYPGWRMNRSEEPHGDCGCM